MTIQPARLLGAATVLLSLMMASCGLPHRDAAVAVDLADRATVLDLPGVRSWEDTLSPEFTREMGGAAMHEFELRKAAGLTGPLPPANYLAISGGGADGAYGAGLLCGWSAAGTRPEFKMVTGISTGALTAPFAFLGTKYDAKLKELYTTVRTADLVDSRGLLSAFFDDALMDTSPLRKLLSKHITDEMLKDIAAEYAKGRLLMIATTNLDAGRAVIWNIGAIATVGTDEARVLIRNIMIASASIPVAFPPVMVDVKVDGKKYQEMHVDGGATAQVFLYPPSYRLRAEASAMGIDRERIAYVIRNARLDPNWADVERRALSIAGRAVSTLIQTQGIGDLYRIYLLTQRDEVDFNLAYIPREFSEKPKEDFDPVYMTKLFEVGYNAAVSGKAWFKRPPGLADENATAHAGTPTPTPTPAATSAPAASTAVRMKLLPSGLSKKVGYYMPQRCELSASRPETITKLPEDLKSPIFGALAISGEPGAVYHVVIDEPEGAPPRLLVDTNGDGDLTNDPATDWALNAKTNMCAGGARVNLGAPGDTREVALSMYRFDKNDPNRAALKNMLLYYRDYGTEGELKLGDKTYQVMLIDETAGGDFRGKPLAADDPKSSSGVQLVIDRNANGRADRRGEQFDVRKPFKIDGVAWELADISKDGLAFRVRRSDKPVEEISLAPDLSAGKNILAFDATMMDGRPVKFPGDYKGKIVMLDFWATWCGPCMAEVPNLVKVYEKHHGEGFEILGITLDQKSAEEKIRSVTGQKGMTWSQVYDGGYWASRVPQMFAVDSIPAAFLVDGDTGKILATTGELRGEALEKTLTAALEKKKAAK